MDLGVFGGAVAERIEILYEGTTLPGYFSRSGAAGEPRRTLIFNNGSDGSVVGAWTDGIACALARGWNAMTFDGPGQNAALVRQGLPFRPDWETVITPVVDFLSARLDTDGDKLALLGVSQAGYWVPRALAYEHRIAAGVADPGVVDVSTTVLGHLPHMMIRLLEAGEKEKFNRDMEWALKISPSTRSMLALRMRPPSWSPAQSTSNSGRDSPRNCSTSSPAGKRSSRSPRPREPTHTASPSALAYAANASSTGSTSRSRPDRWPAGCSPQ